MISFDALKALVVGKTENEASQNVKEYGFTIRVCERDGKSLTVSKDAKPTRLDIVVINDKITKVIN